MTYGQIVARRWKRQYYKRRQWDEIEGWHVQPSAVYVILLELKSKAAIIALLNVSWTKRLPKKKSIRKVSSK